MKTSSLNITQYEAPRRRALITGITGQDGSYLAEFLLRKGYEVHGLVRRAAFDDPTRLSRIQGIIDRIHIHIGSVECSATLHRVFAAVRPDECYHLAAQSFVSYSFDDEASTFNTNINGTHCVLSALNAIAPRCRFYFAGSSEMFGRVQEVPQRESTPFNPRSAYGISKVAGYHITRNYREAHGIHASSGILYNHESPRRGYEFVTRKITSGIAAIVAGKADVLRLGNLEAHRDWGHAIDYVEAMWMMLQQPDPDDYVIATGSTYSVRDFAELAFGAFNLDYRDYVVSDSNFIRPPETNRLVGDSAKARAKLAWSARTTFAELVREMIVADCGQPVPGFRSVSSKVR